jgi:hypothetical protein
MPSAGCDEANIMFLSKFQGGFDIGLTSRVHRIDWIDTQNA